MKQRIKEKPNWADPNTTAENERVPRYLKWAWTSRGVSYSLNMLLVAQLTYYCTDILGMAAATVGMLLLASKIFDGVTDLIVGYIIDRTHSRWGKARPYEIFIVFTWFFTVLMFSVPDMGPVGKNIYIFIMYTMVNSICVTFLNGSEAIYLSRCVRKEENRVSMVSLSGGVVMLVYMVGAVIMPQLIKGIGTSKEGWTVMAISFAIPMSIIGILRFVFVKEVVTTEEERISGNKIPLRTSLKCVAQNKYIFILSLMVLITQLFTLSTNSSTYFCKYIMGDVGLASLITMSSLILPFGMALFPTLSRKLGTTKILRYGLTLGVAGMVLRIVGGTNMVTLVAGSLLSTISQLPLSLLTGIYLIDCMDYGEWKTGIRVEGVLNSVYAFSSKIGSGLTSGLMGIVLGLAGYNGDLAVQSASANFAIVSLFNYIPLVLIIVLLLLSRMYDLGEKVPEMRKELAERKKAANH